MWARQGAAGVRSNRISPWSRSGDLDVAELGLLNIAVHSTTASLLRLRDRCINAMRISVDSRARRGGECPVAAFPVTHYVRDRSAWRIRRRLTDARFAECQVRSRSRAPIPAKDRARSKLWSANLQRRLRAPLGSSGAFTRRQAEAAESRWLPAPAGALLRDRYSRGLAALRPYVSPSGSGT